MEGTGHRSFVLCKSDDRPTTRLERPLGKCLNAKANLYNDDVTIGFVYWGLEDEFIAFDLVKL